MNTRVTVNIYNENDDTHIVIVINQINIFLKFCGVDSIEKRI